MSTRLSGCRGGPVLPERAKSSFREQKASQRDLLMGRTSLRHTVSSNKVKAGERRPSAA